MSGVALLRCLGQLRSCPVAVRRSVAAQPASSYVYETGRLPEVATQPHPAPPKGLNPHVPPPAPHPPTPPPSPPSIKHMGLAMHEELEQQSLLLGDLDNQVDASNLRLRGLRKRTRQLIEETKKDRQLQLIAVLCVVLAILIVTAFL